MNKQMLLVVAVMASAGLVMGESNTTCTSTCTKYNVCTSLNATGNHTAFLNNSLLCSATADAALGKLYTNLSSCSLMDTAIDVADMLDIEWDAVSSLQAIIGDEEFWLKDCQWDQLAAAACIYYSVPADGQCLNNNATVTQKNLFCEGECMNLASSCMNLNKYRHLTDSIKDFCTSVTTTDNNSTTCFKGQVDQKNALHAPDCTSDKLAGTSLTGPYILAGIALALAVVALIGLALITCKGENLGGAPNSF